MDSLCVSTLHCEIGVVAYKIILSSHVTTLLKNEAFLFRASERFQSTFQVLLNALMKNSHILTYFTLRASDGKLPSTTFLISLKCPFVEGQTHGNKT